MEKILRTTLSDGKFQKVDPLRSKMMKSIKGKGNKSTERRFRLALARAKISGWKLNPKLIGNPDIYFPSENIIIYLDGCFWHGCPECGHVPKVNNLYWKTKLSRTIERDKKTTALLKDQGYLVVRFWEHELINDINGCIAYVNDMIEQSFLSFSGLDHA